MGSWCLVLGASHAEAPIISLAQNFGHEVICLSADVAGPGSRLADVFVQGDYSDEAFVETVAKHFEVSSVIAGANDFAALSAAWTANALGLPGHDAYSTAKALHHKHLFKQLALELQLPVAEHVLIQAEQSAPLELPFDFPVLVKPVDLTGGKGISLVENSGAFPVAIALARQQSRRGEVLVERYVTGTNHGLSFLVSNGRIIWSFSDDEIYTCNDFLVAGTTFPSTLKPVHIDSLRVGVERLVAARKLVDGMFHMQVIQGRHGVVIVDVMRRCAGDLYPYFAELSTHFKYLHAYVAPALGLPFPEIDQSGDIHPTARHCVISELSGTVLSLAEVAASKFRKQCGRHVLIPPGSFVERAGLDKVEIAFFQYDTADRMRAESARLAKRLQPNIRK